MKEQYEVYRYCEGVVLGSTEYHHCSNAWIATISIYLVSGPLSLYLLFSLRITLTTATFNGIIFYAKTTNVGILNMVAKNSLLQISIE